MADLKPLHLMHLPYSQDLDSGLEYWYSEILRLKDFLETRIGNKIRQQELHRQICIHNRMRRSFQRLMEANRPGRIHKVIDNPLPRPRKPGSVEMTKMSVHIQKHLEGI